ASEATKESRNSGATKRSTTMGRNPLQPSESDQHKSQGAGRPSPTGILRRAHTGQRGAGFTSRLSTLTSRGTPPGHLPATPCHGLKVETRSFARMRRGYRVGPDSHHFAVRRASCKWSHPRRAESVSPFALIMRIAAECASPRAAKEVMETGKSTVSQQSGMHTVPPVVVSVRYMPKK